MLTTIQFVNICDDQGRGQQRHLGNDRFQVRLHQVHQCIGHVLLNRASVKLSRRCCELLVGGRGYRIWAQGYGMDSSIIRITYCSVQLLPARVMN